ncbi:XRE family transcriptional regulator [Escherichia coli]|uniref:XRE family transcriptional regulator n=1 Tax=Escherichia coli TaxID=562 RepID=UPI003976A496
MKQKASRFQVKEKLLNMKLSKDMKRLILEMVEMLYEMREEVQRSQFPAERRDARPPIPESNPFSKHETLSK